ncbi:MAG: response regulator [Bdellovibrionales bacterium]|nr:response regulator [Bdellovibrionales bacterium]
MAHILLIEDDQQVRQLVRMILEDSGHSVVEAGDGLDGVVRFREEQPDLVICDIVMPKQDGIMAIQEIFRESPFAKVICISGGPRGKAYWLPVASRIGVMKTLRKPVSPDQLLESVEVCLRYGE